MRQRPAYGQPLTDVEIRVVSLAAEGLENKQIGSQLQFSEDMAKTHMRRARIKLGALNRTHAAVLAVASGYLVVPVVVDLFAEDLGGGS